MCLWLPSFDKTKILIVQFYFIQNKCLITIRTIETLDANTLGFAVYKQTRLIIPTWIWITLQANFTIEAFKVRLACALPINQIGLVACATILTTVALKAKGLLCIAKSTAISLLAFT